MRRGETLDEFLEWVCTTTESVHMASEVLARDGRWGIASTCWQVKLRRLQKDFDELKLEVSRCVATRDANRMLFDPLSEIAEDRPPESGKRIAPRNNVIPLRRAHLRTSAR